MSFARLTHDSDVYVYDDIEGGYTCCFCHLQPNAARFNVPTVTAMIDHLLQHQNRGHKVPEYCISALDEEVKKET